jgi:hypothetical protein
VYVPGATTTRRQVLSSRENAVASESTGSASVPAPALLPVVATRIGNAVGSWSSQSPVDEHTLWPSPSSSTSSSAVNGSQSLSIPSHTSGLPPYVSASPSSQSPVHTVKPSPSSSTFSLAEPSQSLSSPSHSSGAPGYDALLASSQSSWQTRTPSPSLSFSSAGVVPLQSVSRPSQASSARGLISALPSSQSPSPTLKPSPS